MYFAIAEVLDDDPAFVAGMDKQPALASGIQCLLGLGSYDPSVGFLPEAIECRGEGQAQQEHPHEGQADEPARGARSRLGRSFEQAAHPVHQRAAGGGQC